jgi:transglutaminase-like putative cysteine protease
MLLEIHHDLTFTYDAWIHESRMELHIQPRTEATQIVHEFNLLLGPRTTPARGWEDWLGNIVHWFGIAAWHERIEIQARSIVDTSAAVASAKDATDPLPENLPELARDDFIMFGGPIVLSELLRETSRSLGLDTAASLGEWVGLLEAGLTSDFEYRPLVTTWESDTDEVLQARAGVCQDFAHISIAFARLRGIPTRYVNGYLHILSDGQAAQSHAWVEFWSPTMGWIPYDPTHHEDPGERHVVVAYGRNYDDCPPNRGLYGGRAKETLHAEVRTRQLPNDALKQRRHIEPAPEIPTYAANPLPPAPSSAVFPQGGPPTAESQQQQQ